MSCHDEDARRDLEEAALLPAGDARRRELVDGLYGAAGEQRDAWCGILAENEDLRVRLRGVDVPPGLLGRVRRVREGAAGRPLVFPVTRAVVVAAALFGVVFGVLLVRSGGPSSSAGPIYQLATLAAMDHAARPEMTIKTDDLQALAEAMDDDLPFDLSIERPEPGAVLIGGRRCAFGDRPLAYTRWRIDGGEVAVYQVRRSEFGLAARQPSREMDVPERGSPPSRCRVRVWSDAEFAYILVRDHRSRPG